MPRMKRIHQIPFMDRPREKLAQKGAAALSDQELLAVLIGSGNGTADVTYIARRIQQLVLQGPDALTYESLTSIKGVNTATAGKILAGLEWASRYLVHSTTPLRSVHDILARLDSIRTKQQEYVVVMSLDGGYRLIAQKVIAIGTLEAVLFHPREIFSDAIKARAASVVIGHNHPSGIARPSSVDSALIQQVAAAGQLLGIELRDHIIVTKTEYYSYRQQHML